MNTASPNLSVSTPRVPQLYVRKFRLEVQEAEGWQVPQRSASIAHVRRRAWIYGGSLLSVSALLLWAGWQLMHA